MLKLVISWLYRKFVNELFVPEYQTFSIGMKCEGANAKIWNSFLPDVLSLKVRRVDGKWLNFTFNR